MQCDTTRGEVCPVGSSVPLAAAGYFAQIARIAGENTTTIAACIPFPFACLGKCSREVTAFILTQESFSNADEGVSLEDCPPGLEQDSCTEGYEGERCSQCTKYNEDIDPCPDAPNGYYRLETRCEPCPCTWVQFHHMIVAVFFGALVSLFVLDHYMSGSQASEHASALAAPLLILVSFCQTIAVFVDTEIPWPATLRRIMVAFSFLNFNLELTRPECAGDFGALMKVKVALGMPVFFALVIASYGLIKLVQINSDTDATSGQKHSARNHLRRRMVSVGTTLFTVGAIFFAKSFLRAFDCTRSETDATRSFMQSAPEIECDVPNSTHADILRLSTIGLVVFIGCLTMLLAFIVRAHRSNNRGLGNFAFLADKFEDRFFYWELVIVARKVLLMSIFLLFRRLAAVLLATFLTIFSLSIHIAARPFEDDGTDWTEMLSLLAQIVTLVAGPVFVVLVRAVPRSACELCLAFWLRHSHDRIGLFVEQQR